MVLSALKTRRTKVETSRLQNIRLLDVQQLISLDLTITSSAITLHVFVLDVLCGRLHYSIESHVRRHSNLSHQPQLLPLQDQASCRLNPLLWLPSPGPRACRGPGRFHKALVSDCNRQLRRQLSLNYCPSLL